MRSVKPGRMQTVEVTPLPVTCPDGERAVVRIGRPWRSGFVRCGCLDADQQGFNCCRMAVCAQLWCDPASHGTRALR